MVYWCCWNNIWQGENTVLRKDCTHHSRDNELELRLCGERNHTVIKDKGWGGGLCSNFCLFLWKDNCCLLLQLKATILCILIMHWSPTETDLLTNQIQWGIHEATAETPHFFLGSPSGNMNNSAWLLSIASCTLFGEWWPRKQNHHHQYLLTV